MLALTPRVQAVSCDEAFLLLHVARGVDPEGPVTAILGELRAVMNTYVAHVLGRKSRLSPRLVPVIPPRSTPSRDA